MRCLTLADALKRRGAKIRFLSRHMLDHLRDMLVERGHELILLKSSPGEVNSANVAHAHWLGTSQHADAQDTLLALSDHPLDWLIVDHYALDSQWESALRQKTKKMLVIDDIADRQHNCDALLDQNFYADMDTRYIGKVPSHCKLLLGPHYALLRDEFRQLRTQAKPRSGPVKRVLVFFGGVDAENYTGRAVEALVNLGIKGLQVDVVIGVQHPYREQIQLACTEHQLDCHVQTSRMAELMAGVDLAIGAGGSATWERCCLGLPTLAICTAENQVRQVADAAAEGLLYAPEIKGDVTEAIGRHLRALMENGCLRLSISRNAMRAVDSRGVLRAIGNMDCREIKIRVAVQADSKQLFEWRNHPTVRVVSRNAETLNWQSHQRWIDSVLTDPDRLLLIGQCDGLPVGVVRFDLQRDEAEVSIYLVPGKQLAGLGRDLLRSAERWFAANRPDVRRLCAHVLGGNEHSQRLFLGAGYQMESTTYSKRLH